MKFQTHYLNRPVVVDYSMATDLLEDLDGVTIIYADTGEHIDYDNLSDGEWFRLWEECSAEAMANLIEGAMS